MYIRFHLYTSMLHIFRKNYFDDSISCVWSLEINKTYFRFYVKNIDIYFICVLNSIHTLYASNVFQYHIFVFMQVLEKMIFYFKIQVLKNTVFVINLIFISQKIVQIVCNMCLFLVTHICTSNIYMNLFL